MNTPNDKFDRLITSSEDTMVIPKNITIKNTDSLFMSKGMGSSWSRYAFHTARGTFRRVRNSSVCLWGSKLANMSRFGETGFRLASKIQLIPIYDIFCMAENLLATPHSNRLKLWSRLWLQQETYETL